ncbi:O-antigen translocase [Persephonella sp.]
MTLLKTSLLTSISTFVKIIAGFIINKTLAVYGGPSGLAIFGQFRDFLAIVSNTSNGAISNGITKYVAEYKKFEKKKKVISSANFITLSSSLLLSFLIFFLSDYISSFLLKTNEFSWVFKILSLVIFAIAFNLNLLSIINGLKRIKEYILFSVLNSLLLMLFSILLISKFGLIGALFSLILTPFVMCIILIIYTSKNKFLRRLLLKINFQKEYIRNLLNYSFMSIVAALSGPGSYIVIRMYIGKNLGWDSAGYWQGIWFISSVYLMVITTSLSVYYLPRLSELDDKEKIKKEIITGFKIVIPITILLALFIYSLKNVIITTIFTSEFKPMIELFKWQLIGDVIKIASWILSYIMIAKAMTRLFIYTEILFSVLFVILSVIGIKLFGLIGVTYAFAFNYFVYLIAMFIFNKKKGYL